MVLSALRPDASLPEFLAHRAKSASVGRLGIDLVIGLAAFVAGLYWRPSAWLLAASLGLIFFAYGGWGITDRARTSAATRDSAVSRGFLDALCLVLGAIGLLASAALLYGVWGFALGTWIS
jgi:hypothetical protein